MKCSRQAHLTILAMLLVLSMGCGGSQPTLSINGADAQLNPPTGGWPADLPTDAAQPWEELDARGRVVPAAGVQRTAQGINADSEYTPGVERLVEAGDVSDLGEASRLASGTAGGGVVSFAQYRIVLGGAQPGAVSADVNLRARSGGGLSEYWLGLSDYGADVWEWHGPLSDAHVRLNLPHGEYLSSLGNLFACVVVCDGSAADVVALGANPRDAADSTPPPQPTGLTVTAVAGGLDLAWNGVIAGDLAGYRVYWRDSWFAANTAVGLKTPLHLEGSTRYLITGITNLTYVRVGAVDLSGNESALSDFASATPLVGSPPALMVTTDEVSGMMGLVATLTATGADSYDWDLDGDGIYELSGDSGGVQLADTSATGIIRPAVRGTSGGGSSVACGAVSLIITGNTRPVANGYADPSTGPAPLTVDFTGAGMDPDGEIVLYSWDFDGNGTYDWTDPVNSNPPDQVYNVPYLRNVKFRIDDDQGAYDVDTVAVLITEAVPGPNEDPVAILSADKTTSYWPFTIVFSAAGSSDPDGSIELYEWDFNGDGAYDAYSTIATATYTYPTHDFYRAVLRVTDDRGGYDSIALLVTLPSEWSMFGMGPERTRRSPYTGAQTNNVKWSWTCATEVRSSPAIGADGTVYIGSLWPDNRLYAVKPDGSYKWAYNGLGEMVSSPAVGPDGTIYIGTSMSELVAIGPGGDNRWTHATSDMVPASPAIGREGDIYIGDLDGRMYALHPDGTLKWDYTIGGMFDSSPAIAPDGTVYLGNTDNNVYAFGADGRPKGGNWPFTAGSYIDCSPAVGGDGTVYIGCDDNKLYAINPDGTEKWTYTAPGNIESSPAIDHLGNIYFGCANSKVYALDSDGDPLGGNWPFTSGGYIESSPAIGADGTIYIGSTDDKFYAINPDGTELWSYTTGGDILSSPAIASDGTVYIGSDDMELYAFGPPM